MLSLSPLSSHEVAERQVWVPTKDRGRQWRRTLQPAIRWKKRETNCLASALFNSLVAAVLVQISCGKPRIGRVHFDSRIAQLEGELWPVIERILLRRSTARTATVATRQRPR